MGEGCLCVPWLKPRAPLKVGNSERAQGVRLLPVTAGFPEGSAEGCMAEKLPDGMMLAGGQGKEHLLMTPEGLRLCLFLIY